MGSEMCIRDRDYATEVLGDSWDMTEGGSNDWNTDDIEAVAINWTPLQQAGLIL